MTTPMVLPAALLATARPCKELTCIEQQQQQQQQRGWVVWATEGVIKFQPKITQTQQCTCTPIQVRPNCAHLVLKFHPPPLPLPWAAGEKQGPRLSSLMQGTNRKQIEGCTRRCVPTCIRGGEGEEAVRQGHSSNRARTDNGGCAAATAVAIQTPFACRPQYSNAVCVRSQSYTQSAPASTPLLPSDYCFVKMLVAVVSTFSIMLLLLLTGAPGLGPISMRREIVVFKDGFRSRQYCLSECAQTCKLISDNEQQQQQKQP